MPASRGTQKLWSVSAESSVRNVGVGCAGSLTGTCSSLAVTTFEPRISIFPPELVADHGDLDSAGRRSAFWMPGDHARRRQKQDHHNQNRNHRPGQFDLRAAVNLRGLARSGSRLFPEVHHRLRKQAEHYQEDSACHREHHERKRRDHVGRCRRGGEDICGAEWGLPGLAQAKAAMQKIPAVFLMILIVTTPRPLHTCGHSGGVEPWYSVPGISPKGRSLMSFGAGMKSCK